MSFLTNIIYGDAPVSTTIATPGTASTAAPQNDLVGMVIPFVFIFIVFYFLIIRPQQRKYKQHVAMVTSIQKGDEIITSGGVHGKVKQVDDSGFLQVEIANNVVVKVLASTVSTVLTDKKTAINDNAANKKKS